MAFFLRKLDEVTDKLADNVIRLDFPKSAQKVGFGAACVVVFAGIDVAPDTIGDEPLESTVRET